MSWNQLADDRWSMDDADDPDHRHLLLRANGRSIELHGHTVHVYDGPDVIVDPQYPLGVPGTDEHRGRWLFTGSVNVGTEAAAWKAMSADEFVTGTGQ